MITREALDLAGSGFTAGALVDVSLDGKVERTIQADPAGNLPPQVLQSPYQARGQGTFTLTAAEQGNPANAVTLPSRTTALELNLRPKRAKPSSRIRFSGSGFTAQRAVWAHYLYKGKLRKTVRLVRRIDNPCGTFSVRRRQIPVKRPQLGRWRLQVDQQRSYSRAPRRRQRPRGHRRPAGVQSALALTGSTTVKLISPSWRVHADVVARREVALQQAPRQRVDEVALDHPLERARAVHRVVAELAELVAGGVGELDAHAALGDPRDQQADLDVDDVAQLLLGERVELDDVVEAVDELGLERRLRAGAAARDVRGHDQHGVAEVDRAALAVGEAAVVHHLQQDVEDVGVGLLDLVEQDRPRTGRRRTASVSWPPSS